MITKESYKVRSPINNFQRDIIILGIVDRSILISDLF